MIIIHLLYISFAWPWVKSSFFLYHHPSYIYIYQVRHCPIHPSAARNQARAATNNAGLSRLLQSVHLAPPLRDSDGPHALRPHHSSILPSARIIFLARNVGPICFDPSTTLPHQHRKTPLTSQTRSGLSRLLRNTWLHQKEKHTAFDTFFGDPGIIYANENMEPDPSRMSCRWIALYTIDQTIGSDLPVYETLRCCADRLSKSSSKMLSGSYIY